MWFAACRKFSGGMGKIYGVMIEYLWSKFFRWGELLLHLPYCKLRRAGYHQFGRLRLWPKLKALGDSRTCCDDLEYRPLVSCVHHHWRSLFSIAAMWCLYVIQVFKSWISHPKCAWSGRPYQHVQSLVEFRRSSFL